MSNETEQVEAAADRYITRIEAQHERELEKLGRVIEAREARIVELEREVAELRVYGAARHQQAPFPEPEPPEATQ